MLPDMEMITHSFPASKGITIVPVADVHLGALEHNAAAWEAFRKEIEAQPDTYIMLVGDLINNSVRASVANPFDEVLRPREQKRLMVEHLEPIRDRILCSVSGNHERRSLKDSDVDITYDIMTKLDIEHLYRENMAFVKVGLGDRASRKGTPECSFVFAVTHGSALAKNERFGNVIDGVDCLVVGHTHKGVVSRPSKIVVDARNEKITMRNYTVVSAESWLSYGGYAAQKMLLPSETANPQRIYISASGRNKRLEVRW